MNKFLTFIIVLTWINVLTASGQDDPVEKQYVFADTLSEDFGLFDSDELLEISLKFNITQYKKKKSDKEYLDAIMTYCSSKRDTINKVLKIRSRGEFRRGYCDFPPLMLNFKTKDTIEGEFSRIDKIKMVTHCKAGNEEYLLKEYLVYKLYNTLTDNSYRVRLLRVNYINSFKKSKPVSEYAFVIEPNEVLAKRTNSIEVKLSHLTQKNIKPEVMDRMAIFNYMIGNTDWAVPINHNILVLSQMDPDRSRLGLIVPYDFDYSGLVDADYAIPYEGLGIKSVRDRLYTGMCRSEEVFLNALKDFINKKDEFYKVIREFPYLNDKSKKYMISYLNSFYDKFDSRNTIVRNLLNNCKKL